MSTVAAIYERDGRPCRKAELRQMTDTLAERGPDGAGYWTSRNVGLGFRLLNADGDPAAPAAPVSHSSADLAVSADICLYNREELASGLNIRQVDDFSDADLVLRAYDRWDLNCFEHLDGDWALALWDGRRQRMVLCRDRFGAKPLNYWHDGARLIAASDPLQVCAHPKAGMQVNWSVAAAWMCFAYPFYEETHYEGVRRLPLAHYAVVDSGGLRFERYWPAADLPEMRFSAETDYADGFREHFERAVKARLRSRRKVAIEVSGGLDSSSIACSADQILRKEPGAGAEFETVSILFPGLDCDESEFSESVARKVDRKHHRLQHGIDVTANGLFEKARRWPTLPCDPGNLYTAELISGCARENGMGVVLEGLGGDELFDWTPGRIADRLRERDWAGAKRDAVALARRSGLPAWRVFARNGLWPLLPSGTRNWIRHERRKFGSVDVVPYWFDPDFVRETRLTQNIHRSRRYPSPFEFPRESQQSLFDCLVNSYTPLFALEYRAYLLGSAGIEARQPYFDRRLCEFCLSIPDSARISFGEEKHLLRRAMRGVLPEAVRRRQSKPNFDSLWDPTSRPRHLNVLEDLLDARTLEREGVLARGATDRILRQAPQANYSSRKALEGLVATVLWRSSSTNSLSQGIGRYAA